MVYRTENKDNRYRFQPWPIKVYRWIRWLPWQWFTFLRYLYYGCYPGHAWDVTCGELDYHMGRWVTSDEFMEELERGLDPDNPGFLHRLKNKLYRLRKALGCG